MSTSHLMNSWAQLCRGTPISSAPSIDRTVLRARNPPTPSFRHVEYLPPPPALPATTAKFLRLSADPPATAVDIFKLTRSDLARLHSRLPTSSIDDEAAARPRLSTHAVVAAHVWRCVSLARGLPPEQPTFLLTAVDGRSRLQRPPLPDGFFGNVVFTSAVASKPTATAAPDDVIQAALDRMDDSYCRSALDYLDLQPDKLSELLPRWAATTWYNLAVTSWVRMPIQDADFGWGRPVFMGPGGMEMEGQAFVLRSAHGDDGLSVAICLRAEHMDKFRVLMYDDTVGGECTS